MSDSTIGIIIEEKDKPVISVKDENEDGKTADIWIDMRDLHFSLTLPANALLELVKKGIEFLGKKKEEIEPKASIII